MSYALLSMVLIEAALYFFGGQTTENTPIFGALLNPTGITATVFYGVIIILLAASIAATITPGFIYQTNQFALFAAASFSFITYVIVAAHLWSFLVGELVSIFSCDPNAIINCTPAILIAFLICSPIIIVYLMAMAEWTRFNQ